MDPSAKTHSAITIHFHVPQKWGVAEILNLHIASNWEDVPTIKIPSHPQHGPIVTQQQIQAGTPAQTGREASTYRVPQQIPTGTWRSPSHYHPHQSPATPQSGATSALSDVSQQQQQSGQPQQWTASPRAAQNPHDSVTPPRSALSESMDYSYMIGGGGGPSAQPQRANSHPSLYQSLPQGTSQQQQQQQQMRHPSEGVGVGHYSQMPQEQMIMMQQQQQQQQQRHQRGQSAQPQGSQHASQPQQQQQHVRVTTSSHEQPIFYAPFSRQ